MKSHLRSWRAVGVELGGNRGVHCIKGINNLEVWKKFVAGKPVP